MKRSLSKKFALIFALILCALFTALLIAVQIIAVGVTDSYIQNDVFANHARMNDRLCVILDEINYGYTRMTQCDEISLLESDDEEVRKDAFYAIVSNASLSSDYVNVVLAIDGEIYSQNEGFDMPANSFIRTVESGNRILYQGALNSNMGYIEIGRRFQKHNLTGAVIFYVKEEILTDICLETDSSLGYSQLITEDYLILAKSVGEDAGKTILEKENYPLSSSNYSQKFIGGAITNIVVTEATEQYNMKWYFVSVLDNSALTKDFTILGWVLFTIAIISLGVAILLAFRLSKKITSPINELSAEISAVDFTTGRGIIKFAEEGDELYALWQNYDLMIKRLFKLMDENIENIEIQRKLELDALQSQINPHFLYNTLDAIAWMAKIKKQPEIEVLVINLAKFFRLSLHKGDKYVSIADEVEIVEHFLEIEKIRFPDSLTYSCDIPEELREYRVLKLVLQPIVENCIKHGFADHEGAGHIHISARVDGDDIILSVEDNGCGFNVSDNFFEQSNDGKPGGYGLKNVNKRVMLEYGKSYGMSIISEVGKGTRVDVRIQKTI